MTLLNWPTITDDSGTKQDGTVLNKSLFDDIKASIEDTLDAGFDGLVIGFTGTAVADEVQVGDTAFKLDFDGGGASVPALQFASGDRLQYDRASDAFLFMVGGVEGFRISSALARLPNAAALSWRNAGGSANVEVLSLDSSDRAILGKDATSVRLPNARAVAWLNAAGNADLDVFKVTSSDILEIGEDATSVTIYKVVTFDDPPVLKAGTSTVSATVGGHLSTNTTAVGNIGAGEDDLMSYSVGANVLSANGKLLRITVSGTFANNANQKTLKAYFGATAITWISANVWTNARWNGVIEIIRTGAATQLMTLRGTIEDGSAFYGFAKTATPAETLSGAVIFKMTGESAAAATDDVKQNSMVVEVVG